MQQHEDVMEPFYDSFYKAMVNEINDNDNHNVTMIFGDFDAKVGKYVI